MPGPASPSAAELRGQCRIGSRERLAVALLQRGFDQVERGLVEEPPEVGHRHVASLRDEVARHLEAGARLVERGGVLRHPVDLGLAQRMAAELDEHEQLAHPTALSGAGEHRRGLLGADAVELGHLDIAVEVALEQRTDDRALLVGGAVVDVGGGVQGLGDVRAFRGIDDSGQVSSTVIASGTRVRAVPQSSHTIRGGRTVTESSG